MIPVVPCFKASALLIVDMQNDFVLPSSPAEIRGSIQVVPRIQHLQAAFRRVGLPIIHVIRLYREDGSNAEACRRSVIAAGKRMVAPGTQGSEIVEPLRPGHHLAMDHNSLLAGGIQRANDRELILYKPRWGGFYETSLDDLLKELHVDTLVICGCNFPNCPRTTIYQASERDFGVVFVPDATSGSYPRGNAELAGIGVAVMRTDVVAAAV